jgi:hypothetical protein
MSAFKSFRMFPMIVPDLALVANEVAQYFERQGFEVTSQPTVTHGWDISITKGGVFKAVLGLKTALKINIEPAGTMTNASAGIGIFGSQAIPTAITLLLFWPVLITQIWGMVQNSKLDEEAMQAIEASLRVHSSSREGQENPVAIGNAATMVANATRFCTECGAPLSVGSRFCANCGVKVG